MMLAAAHCGACVLLLQPHTRTRSAICRNEYYASVVQGISHCLHIVGGSLAGSRWPLHTSDTHHGETSSFSELRLGPFQKSACGPDLRSSEEHIEHPMFRREHFLLLRCVVTWYDTVLT